MALNKGFSYARLLCRNIPTKLDALLLAVGILAAVAAGIPFPLLGVLFGQFVDELNTATCEGSRDFDTGNLQLSVNRKVLLVVYITIANFAAIYIHTGCWSLFGERLVRRLRRCYFRSLLRQEIAFFEELPAGEVSARLTGDMETIRAGTSEKVGICISSFSYLLAAYLVAFMQNARLAGMLVCLIPAYSGMAVIGSRYVGRYTSRMSDHIAAAISIASEALSNVALVHAFGAHRRLEAKLSLCLERAKKDGLKKAVAAATQFGLLFFIAYSANALAFWQGSKIIAATADAGGSGITAGAVYTIIFLLVDATFIISQVAPFLQIFGAAAASAEKLQVVIDRPSHIDGVQTLKGQRLGQASGAIAFENVSFQYPSRSNAKVLRSVSLTFPSGSHTAIVGPSGSGKSTIAALITRLYDPSQGRITLDGNDIRDINVRYLRSIIGIVHHDSWLLDRSVLENIAHGLINSLSGYKNNYEAILLGSGLSDLVKAVQEGQDFSKALAAQGPAVTAIVDLVRDAATTADADKFIRHLEHGYASRIRSKGNELSGGQKQRIALARALVKDPIILILDEATSSLDSASEQNIQASLKNISGDKTIISISHRLSTVRDANSIIVLKDGQVTERATHSGLIERGQTYANMVQTLILKPTSKLVYDTPEKIRTSEAQNGTSRETLDTQNTGKQKMTKPLEQVKEGSNDQIENEKDSQRSAYSTMRGIASLARPQLLFIFIAFVAATVVGGSYSGEAVIFGHTIGSFSPCRKGADIRASGNLYGLLFFVFAIVELLASIVNGATFGRIAEKMVFKVRVLCFRSLFYQNVQWHASNSRSLASKLSYLSSDANALAGLSGTVIGTVLAIVVNLFAGILISHIIAWKIAVVLLATMPILLSSGVMRLRMLARYQIRHQIAYATSVGITIEAVNSMKSVASLSLEKEFFEVYDRSLVRPYKASFREIAAANFWLATAYSVSILIYALAYWWGAKQIIAGTYSQTQFFIVLPALLFSAQSCGQMFALAPDLSNARVASARLLNLLDLGPVESPYRSRNLLDIAAGNEMSENGLEAGESLSMTRSRPADHLGSSVKFHNVHFSYPARPHIKVLQGINLDILPVQFCALIGHSGAGKSTIISLLEKFYAPSSGKIEIDGRYLTEDGDASFRDRISLVPQESVLFDDTIRFNIAIGARPEHEATDEEIETACRLANIHDTIAALPQGYHTQCGPNGDRFSGGQKQRLSIARALVRQPSLLLLDEPTSALDAESEARFQDTLDKVSRHMTIIAIAHRLRTIQKAHVIFMIEEGRCADQGSHAELFQRNATYRANALYQSLGA